MKRRRAAEGPVAGCSPLHPRLVNTLCEAIHTYQRSRIRGPHSASKAIGRALTLPPVEMLEFLERLSSSINSVLPEGFEVAPNRRPDLLELHEASAAEADSLHRRFLAEHPNAPSTGAVTEVVHIFGKSELNPYESRLADEPDMLFDAPADERSASGSYVYGYFDETFPWGESADSRGRMVEAALHVLDDLQDSLCEGMREPWPNKGVAPVPSPRGEVVDGFLRLWFEDQNGPVIELPAVTLG
jgi:hypothetical protein